MKKIIKNVLNISLLLLLLTSCNKNTQDFIYSHYSNSSQIRENLIFNNDNNVNLKEYNNQEDFYLDFELLENNKYIRIEKGDASFHKDLFNVYRIFSISILSRIAYYPLSFYEMNLEEDNTYLYFDFNKETYGTTLDERGNDLAYHYFFIPIKKDEISNKLTIKVTFEKEDKYIYIYDI